VSKPPFEKNYAWNVVLVVLALFPGLINTSAVGLLAPIIAGDIDARPDMIGGLPLFSDAALAFGALLAADFTRRFDSRVLFYVLVAISLCVSLASAVAPNFDVLLVAHILHGLVSGMLFVVMLPPLLLGFGSKKIGASAVVLVPCLFGAATLGPLVGGLLTGPQHWRILFAVEVPVAIAVMIVGYFTLAARPAKEPDAPVDWYAHIVSAIAAGCIFTGAGQLAGHDWTYLPAIIPVALGVAAFIALIVGENLLPNALVPVKGLSTSLALVGIIAAVLGSAAYSALSQSFILQLERISGLGIRETGFAFWPQVVAALLAGVIFGRLITTKWVVLAGAGGLVFTAITAALALLFQPLDFGDVRWLSFAGGIGAGFAVTPGLFLVALTYEGKVVARAIAMLNLLRLTGTYISAPGVEHSIGTRARDWLAATGEAHGNIDAIVRDFLTTGHVQAGASITSLQDALGHGISDAFVIVLGLALIGVALIAFILIHEHVPLTAPDMKKFDEGQPALAPH
jgi:MFS family permease